MFDPNDCFEIDVPHGCAHTHGQLKGEKPWRWKRSLPPTRGPSGRGPRRHQATRIQGESDADSDEEEVAGWQQDQCWPCVIKWPSVIFALVVVYLVMMPKELSSPALGSPAFSDSSEEASVALPALERITAWITAAAAPPMPPPINCVFLCPDQAAGLYLNPVRTHAVATPLSLATSRTAGPGTGEAPGVTVRSTMPASSQDSTGSSTSATHSSPPSANPPPLPSPPPPPPIVTSPPPQPIVASPPPQPIVASPPPQPIVASPPPPPPPPIVTVKSVKTKKDKKSGTDDSTLADLTAEELAAWEVHEGSNCWWDGHGAEEIDPRGAAVPNVDDVDACKASCLAAGAIARCDGVLWSSATRGCFRKANVQLALCSTDASFTLYLRTDSNRPLSPARAVKQAGLLTGETCSAMVRNPAHKFYILWAVRGWSSRKKGEPGCWDVNWNDDWFDWVSHGSNCEQDWGGNLKAPTVFGFKESMTAYCDEHGGHATDPGVACRGAHLNILRTGNWNMCRNVEWMHCVVQGKANWGGGGSGEIIFTHGPKFLNIDAFNAQPGWYVENDIYYLEVCVLSEMCSNYEDIFRKGHGDSFFCAFDPARWAVLGRDLSRMK